MKIGPKIASFYSLITMCAIIMVMSVFYLFSSRISTVCMSLICGERIYHCSEILGKKMKLTNRAIG